MSTTRAEDHRQQSAQTLAVIRAMEKALGENADNMADYFHDDFRWIGNFGCGTKNGLEAFRANWQLPLRAAFTERTYHTQQFLADGEWASCFGRIEGTHTGVFMGISPTAERVTIPYMDFWQVRDGKIADNWVSVDYASVLNQLGVDVFAGHGWEAFDRGEQTPPRP